MCDNLWHPGMPDEYKNQIVTGDARELAKRIPDESVDLIFTDPVYQNIEDYRWLAEMAARVLKEDRACLTWVATPLLSRVLKAMEPPLDYAWIMHWQRTGPCYPGKPGICVITQCAWMQKGKSRTYHKIADWAHYASGQGSRYSKYKWGKPAGLLLKWLQAFSMPDHITVDFFTGSGTVPAVCKMLGRNYVAFEIDPQTAENARQRVANTQPPLFVLEHEQLPMEIANG